jgi:hypothetical protein
MAKAVQFTISVAKRPGKAAAIRVLAEAQVNILSILGWNPAGLVQIVTDNPRRAKKALDGAAISYKEDVAEVVQLPNVPGALLAQLEKVAKTGANLRSLCATTAKGAETATVVWTVESG